MADAPSTELSRDLGLFIGSGLWAIFSEPSSVEKFRPFPPEGLGGIFSAMGRDKNLPDFFAEVNDTTKTPYLALIASGALIIAMAVGVPEIHEVAAADVMFMLLFLQVTLPSSPSGANMETSSTTAF